MEQDRMSHIKDRFERLQYLKDHFDELDFIPNAWCGDGYNRDDGNVFFDFFIFFDEFFKDDPAAPPWAGVYMQVFLWQYMSCHEGAETYYENFYGETDVETIEKTSRYLNQWGFLEIAQWYDFGLLNCVDYSDPYPEEKWPLCKKIDDWILENPEIIFAYYYDLLMKHRDELLRLL